MNTLFSITYIKAGLVPYDVVAYSYLGYPSFSYWMVPGTYEAGA